MKTNRAQERILERMQAIRAEGRYRVFADLTRHCGSFPTADYRSHDANGKGKVATSPDATGSGTVDEAPLKSVTIWCANDYLGMGQHPDVIRVMHEVLDSSGAGAGGTRNISGTNHHHVLLEKELANLHGKSAALLFTSGWVANLTTLSSLGRGVPELIIYSDEMNHNSMIEGIRSARCLKRVFRHSDVQHLAQLMAADDPSCPKLIAFESLYSMDGDFAPIREIVEVAKQFGAITFLDEVHAVGLYGPEGAGVAARDGVADQIDIIQGTLAKAFGGIGGYIAADEVIVDFVRSFGTGFIFTTALAPATTAGALEAIRVVRRSDDLRWNIHDRATRLKELLMAEGVPVMDNPSHIVPVFIGDPVLCKRVTDHLLEGFSLYVQPINYPTVPRGTERLRLTPSPLHTEEQIRELVEAIVQTFAKLEMPLETDKVRVIRRKLA